MATAQPQKKKSQPSRKGKKAWRKNVDIADLEEGIDEMRTEERLGGKISEKSNESLFTLDTQGDAKVKRTLAKNKPLRIDEILAERTAVPAVASKPSSLKSGAAGKSNSTAKVSKYTKRKLEELVRRKRDVIGEPTVMTRDRGITEAVKKSGTYDVWGETQDEEVNDDDYLRPVKKVKVKPPPTITRKPKPLLHYPAVKIPPPGASYNPTVQDHQELLRQAHEVELVKAQAREARAQAATERRIREAENNVEEQKNEEDDDNEENGEEEDGDVTERAAAKDARKKTRTERNRQLRVAEQQREEEKRRRGKAMKKELGQVEEIKKTMEATVEEKSEEAKKRAERKEKREREQGGRLAKLVLRKQPIDVQLQDELAESLRTLKPEGNLFKDRFNSLRERNIIEPRIPLNKRRRYKLKQYEKHSYKRFQ